MEVPAIISTGIFASSKAFSTPICAQPRAAPPPSARAMPVGLDVVAGEGGRSCGRAGWLRPASLEGEVQFSMHPLLATHRSIAPDGCQDRKSTRLNSSHVEISYAVF